MQLFVPLRCLDQCIMEGDQFFIWEGARTSCEALGAKLLGAYWSVVHQYGAEDTNDSLSKIVTFGTAEFGLAAGEHC